MLLALIINLELLAVKSEPPIERQILDYLAENPRARDTLRGIVEWWLLKQNIAHATAEVKTALANLVAERKVKAHAGPDGQVYYCAGLRRMDGGPAGSGR
jgi:hypothetical protein